jgi:hypothetical protein
MGLPVRRQTLVWRVEDGYLVLCGFDCLAGSRERMGLTRGLASCASWQFSQVVRVRHLFIGRRLMGLSQPFGA